MAVNQIHILKGRFKALTTNTFGIFIIFINRTSKSIEKMSVIASHFSSMYDHDPCQPWDKFEDIIAQMRFNGEISTSLSNDFQALFVSSFLSDIIELFIDSFDMKNFTKTEHVIQSLVEKILSDKNISLQLEKETISKEDLERVKLEREQKSKPAEASPAPQSPQDVGVQFKVDEGSVILNVGLVIGPISGIPIYDVKPGDQIVVKISGRTQKDQYFIDLLGARNEAGEVLPVPAVVKEVQASSGTPKEYNLLVEIGPGIFGKATEQEQVKLKRYDPLLDARNVKKAGGSQPGTSPVKFHQPAASNAGKSSSVVFLWLIGGIALLLTIVFILFLNA
jgi:hypothetical protein